MEAWIEGKVWRNGNMVTTMLKTEEYQGWIWKFQKEEAVEIVARVHSSSLPHALHPKNSWQSRSYLQHYGSIGPKLKASVGNI